MELKDAKELIHGLVTTGETHQDYAEVCELAKKLKILITGKNTAKLLKQVASREDAAQFKQRVALTKSITPACASSVMVPFNKVSRNQRIRKSLTTSSDEKTKLVEEMKLKFYGGQNRKNKGLEGWLKTRYMELTFTDPNAWVVAEWDRVESQAKAVTARPFEVSCFMAKNFKVVNGVTKWLFVEQDVKMRKWDTDKTILVNGKRFTLYDEDYSIVWEIVDKDQLIQDGYVLRPGQKLIDIETVTYLTEWYEHKVGFVPAVRIGYKTDLANLSRTFVNPFHDGMCFFDKSIKTVSEFDLSMTLHTFPQKLQYIDACMGLPAKRCNSGLVTGSNETCSVCKGTGYNVHTSASDVIYRKMPKTKDDMIDLDKTLVYKTPPIDLIRFQNEYGLQLKSEIHEAVFNSQVFVRKTTTSSSDTGGTPTQTATENDNNMQSVYDTLEPFTEHMSEVYKDFVLIMAIITGEKIEDVQVEHNFPPDYKLKTSDVLIRELKDANDSGAPSFLKDSINNDLAEILFAGDQLGLAKNKIRRRFFPFNGKSADEILLALSSPYVTIRNKVLYYNFENIMSDIELENPKFDFMLNIKEQNTIVNDKVQEYIDALGLADPLSAAESLRKTISNAAGGNTGNQDPNPGDTNTDPQNADNKNPID